MALANADRHTPVTTAQTHFAKITVQAMQRA